MKALLRFLANLVLAVLLVVAAILLVVSIGGLAVARVWERHGLDYGVDGGEWIWIEGEPIHWRVWGPDDGPPVVLIHGLEAQGSLIWRENAENLGRWGVRAITVDLRGFGHSSRDAEEQILYTVEQQALLLAKVLNQLQVREATVVAHGWGGHIALQLLEQQPQFVSRLVLVSPWWEEPETISLWRRAARPPYTRRAATWLMVSGGPLWRTWQAEGFADESAVPEGYWQESRQPTRIVGTIESLAAMARIRPPRDMEAALADATVPVEILVGRDDPYTDLEMVEELAAALPHVSLTVLPAGHYPQVERASAVDRVLSEAALGTP